MWWDERVPGRRLKSLVFLLHPGPSLLVTACFVAIASLAAGHAPGAVRALQLAGVMLPIQFAIGVANDVWDKGTDSVAKPYKPLVLGAIGTRGATVAAIVLALSGLGVAATVSPVVLGLTAGGLTAGLAYDAGLRRTPFSLMPWWAAFVVLPLAAFAAAGRVMPGVVVLVPLSGLLALSLHLANGLPDIDGDRAAGRRSLPVLLGAARARVLSLGAMAAAAVVAVDVARPLDQRFALVAAGAGFTLLVVGVAPLVPARRLFVVLAPAAAVLAVTWLAALPGS